MYSVDLQSLRDEYSSRTASHELFRRRIHEKMSANTKNWNFYIEIHSRVKEVDSFIKKAMRKKYPDPLSEIKDQVGFRLITSYQVNLKDIDEFIQSVFRVVSFEDKLDSLDYNQLGYLGLHYEVCLQDVLPGMNPYYNEMFFEIQVHTKAQNLWASISHELDYKLASGSLPPEIKRSFYRLGALIEIFDKEVNSARANIIKKPEFPELHLLLCLERVFHMFSSRKYDKEFSIQNLSFLKDLLGKDEIENFQEKITGFSETNKDKLASIFSSYSLDSRDSYKMLMLFQPESVFIFERLERDKFHLFSVWRESLPIELLNFLATIWGVDLPDS